VSAPGRAERPFRLTRPVTGAPPTPTVPRPDRFTLSNGLRVLAVEWKSLPQIAMRMVVPAGSATEPLEHPGTASLVGALLTEGTERLSAIELNERLDALGASFSARVGHDFAELDLTMLAETVEPALQLFSELVTTAIFPDREVERIRAEVLDALEARLDEPANVADDQVAESLFGPAHPYGRLPLGTVEGTGRVEREELLGFHRTRYRPVGSILVIAGDLRGVEVRKLLESNFGSWSGNAPPVEYPVPPPVPVSAGTLSSLEWPESPQGEIRVAGVGLRRSSPDWIPAAVANYILGGSTITGRLGANLREEKGWTYGIRSGFAAGLQPAGWMVETAVEAEATGDAIAEIEHEVSRMTVEPVSLEEIERAREALVLSLPRAFETPGRIVARLATVEAFGLEPDYWERFGMQVQRVTPEDILRIATEYFATERLVKVAVGPRFEIAG
jgi:zinc protease